MTSAGIAQQQERAPARREVAGIESSSPLHHAHPSTSSVRDGCALSDAPDFPPPPPLPDTSGYPVLRVHLDPRSGRLAWKLAGKGRWRGRCAELSEVSREADAAGVPCPRVIDYVDERS